MSMETILRAMAAYALGVLVSLAIMWAGTRAPARAGDTYELEIRNELREQTRLMERQTRALESIARAQEQAARCRP